MAARPRALRLSDGRLARFSGIGMTSARTRERLVARLREQGIGDSQVLDRIRSVPRHLFVDEALASRAYEDTALPIGHGQTISQPYIVARMTEALIEGGAPRKVLEIGTGCGYQTAVLAPLVVTLYSVERIAALQQRARKVLRDLRIRNVHMRHGDGFEGWAAYAPFDGIIVAAAAHSVPPALLEQLAPRRAAGHPGRSRTRAAADPHHPSRRRLRARAARAGDVRAAARRDLVTASVTVGQERRDDRATLGEHDVVGAAGGARVHDLEADLRVVERGEHLAAAETPGARRCRSGAPRVRARAQVRDRPP